MGKGAVGGTIDILNFIFPTQFQKAGNHFQSKPFENYLVSYMESTTYVCIDYDNFEVFLILYYIQTLLLLTNSYRQSKSFQENHV